MYSIAEWIQLGDLNSLAAAVALAPKEVAEWRDEANSSRSALHLAAGQGRVSMIDLLSFQLNATDSEGKTPLHLAAQAGRLSVVDRLLALEAQLDPTDNRMETPMYLAAEEGHPAVVARLVEAGSKGVSIFNCKGYSAAHLISPSVAMIAALGQAASGGGTTPWYSTRTLRSPKRTPFQLAVLGGSVEAVRAMFELSGRNPDLLTQTDTRGNNALALCVRESNSFDMAKLLCSLAGDIGLRREDTLDKVNVRGETALHLACSKGHIPTLGLLLRVGTRSLAKADKSGAYPLDLCLSGQHWDAAQLLLCFTQKTRLRTIPSQVERLTASEATQIRRHILRVRG